MVEKITQAKELAAEWQKLKDDRSRLKFIQQERNNIMVMLDNDDSSISFIADENLSEEESDALYDIESGLASFDQYFGCNDGILMLFEFLHIRSEEV